jgi:hypothetical protein
MLVQRMYVQRCTAPGHCIAIVASQLQDDGTNMQCTVHMIYDLPFGLGRWLAERLARRNAQVNNATLMVDIDWHESVCGDRRG